MSISRFPTLTDGHPPGRKYPQQVVYLGEVNVPSGRFNITAPSSDYDYGATVVVPPGAYPVKLTLFDQSRRADRSKQEPAYLSVVLDDSETVRADFLSAKEDLLWNPRYPSELAVEHDIGVVDADALEHMLETLPRDSYLGEIPGYRDNPLYASAVHPKTLRYFTCGNFELPGAARAENSIELKGLNNGPHRRFPIIGTFNAHSRLTGVHLDFEVDGPLPEHDNWAPDPTLVPPAEKRGFFKSLFNIQ